MPGRFELKPTLAKIWHAPDNFRIMEPLPPMHRRGIIIAAIVLVIGFLLPASETSDSPVVTREAQLVAPQNDPDQVAPVASEPIQEGQPEEQNQPQTQPFQQDSGIGQQWRSYRVEPGKTLAQLFRDHGLPPTDVYAMAQVEGAGKPLSNLKNGQMIKIRQNASGVVTGLTIDGDNGQQVLFTRQPDGSFIRAQ
ncbi:opacity-associated protein A [Salmonella enterica subsp. enterica serovar Typhi]|uniref:LysM-like peptidoglycan-binding domain-containing protein n=1 Tax=Salmonella enterica TaxID=28901 RepID=UPI0005E160B8|nr:OapA family protein [Salmonella enterica]CFX39189.1 opacity-associated protein A [Salmonella enterica subsp. enterica serovar Typhi]CFX52524.1 opacity-associated protein A [Salmonella enterica subsp. enterica serovar Typhi]CGI17513.1 opacity-associated protein A [Salmonella enterica subsp. enterica serovar Typhi]CGI36000.1 opacity-associated protein A [Salmonella enterica subsp. enterica serovar Typhi]CHM39344.1 opacity-associated protein A [Salmonella enterica subsp. enterica serovar Typhi